MAASPIAFIMMKTFLRSLCLLLLPAPLSAQEPAAVRKVVLPNADAQVRARLLALDARRNPVHTPNLAAALTAQLAATPLTAFAPILADNRNNDLWEQLPDDYYRLTQESGDALVNLEEAAPAGSGWTSVQVRRLCHQRLASLPRTSLALYRQRVNAEANALFEQGRVKRSPIPLRRLVDELFCSRAGDQALDLLGDLAFERGDFDEARYWWRYLTLHFPDPQVDVLRAEAKQTLALIFQGRFEEAKAEIDGFRKRHPRAQGALAGEQGFYHEILVKALVSWQNERIANNDEAWTTFGGAPSRSRILSQALSSSLLEDGPAWRVALPTLNRNAKERPPDRFSLVRRLAFHPLIVNDQVLIADQRSVVSYHLKTGKELFRYDLKTAGLSDPGPGIAASIHMPRFTLSADHERAYVRLGCLSVGPTKEGDRDEGSYLVCLDLTDPAVHKKRELWHIKATSPDKVPICFEGSPLIHDGRIFIALSKMVDRRVVTTIACYDTLGRLRWTHDVCDVPDFDENAHGARQQQHLLTLAGGQIVYASHTGAIVAVDAWTGQPTWAVRYPSRGLWTAELAPSPRDLAPCVYADGFVYAAPLDSDRLFCIDALSGRVRWEAEEVEIVHLLGVAHGRLFAATHNGMQAFNAATGRSEWSQPSAGRLPSLGRGLLAGSGLYWPTQDSQLPNRVISLSDGFPQIDPARLNGTPPGNWAFGQGCLAIAGLSELVVYAPPRYPPKPLDPPPHARIKISGFRALSAE